MLDQPDGYCDTGVGRDSSQVSVVFSGSNTNVLLYVVPVSIYRYSETHQSGYTAFTNPKAFGLGLVFEIVMVK
jgi:hypothetical protein